MVMVMEMKTKQMIQALYSTMKKLKSIIQALHFQILGNQRYFLFL